MNWKIDTLGKKIGLGFMLISVVLAAAVLITISQVRDVNTVSDRINTLRQPSSRAEIELLNGINRSIADLRGWVMLKRDTFKVGREQAWENDIRPQMARLEELSLNWTSPENVERLAILKPLIDQLEQYQVEAEELAVTDIDQAAAIIDDQVLAVNKRIREVVGELIEDHERLLLEDFANINNQISFLRNIEWMLLGGGLLISVLLALFITNSITVPVAGAVRVAQNIGAGDLQTQVNVGGSKELERLGAALIEMRDSLIQKNEETQRSNWLTDGQNKLNNVMRGDQSIEELANNIINFMARYSNASIGALYLMDDDTEDKLNLTGMYSFSSGNGQSTFKVGEGLIGQAAADKQTIRLDDLEEQHFSIKSSVIEAPPRNILAAPFFVDGEALGVVELGKFDAFDETQIEFIESNMENVGIALFSAIARKKIQDLLEETQLQSEELQQQQEELEQNNEELEEQAQNLKEQQEELRASNEELEEQTQVVEQKNEDLEKARTEIELKAKQLETSSKYKSEFLANMSHELRTPLNSLLILSNDLAKNKHNNLSEDELENAEVIAKSGRDLLTLINEILDLSKIEAGRMELNMSDVAISELANDLSRNFKKQAEEKGLKLETQIDEALPEVIETDRQRLEQILKNLLSNALKFTSEGEINVSFTRYAGDFVSIAVSDTGIGVPKEKIDLIFEAFQQAEGGTSRQFGGTGLGLSISRELTRLLNGRITVESSEGEGSTFTITFPLRADKSAMKVPANPGKAKQQKTVVVKDSHFINYPTIEDQRDEITDSDNTILIIEDDLDFAKILARQAMDKGFKYIAASTGEDGLVLAEQFQPTAIILDLFLPGIDGHMVLKELKGNPDVRHIPVHIISAEEKSLDTIKSGAVQYITKPVTEDQLQEAFGRIEDFIERKMKNLLVVEDNESMRKSIIKLIGNGDVQCFEAGTGTEALESLKKNHIDCIVLDIGLPDISGFDLIKKIGSNNEKDIPPIIVYTGKELSKKEAEKLQGYAETIIVKGIKSEERLLDESALFLHRTVKNLPKNKQEIITGLYDREKFFQGKKVLLVDDDMRNVFALSKVLSEKGLDIEKAENGRVALETLNEKPDINLVLMDIMMPEMDGYECMRKIRKQEKFSNLPVIALTAKAMKDDRQKCLDAGANDYITKPVDVERLLSLMRIWIKK